MMHTLRPILMLLAFAAMAFGQPAENADPSAEAMRSLRDQQRKIFQKIQANEDVEAARRELLANLNSYNLTYKNDINGLTFAGQVSGALGDSASVDANYGRIMALQPQRVREGLAWAAYYYDIDLPRSEEILLQLMKNAPDNMVFPMSLYELHAKAMPERLEERFALLLPVPPGVELHGFLAGVGSVDQDMAIAFAQRVLAAWPDDPQGIYFLASRLRWGARYQDALDLFSRLDDDMLLRDDIGVQYSDCLFALHRFDESIAHLIRIQEEQNVFDKSADLGIGFRLGTRPRMIETWKAEQSIRELDAARGDTPLVRMTIDGTPILIELFDNEAPVTVANFLALAEEGFYDRSEFHRVHPGLMSQGGRRAGDTDPYGGPGYSIVNEGDRDDARGHFRGSIAMANVGPDHRIGSQFYLTHFPTQHLDTKNPVFGRVISGFEIVEAMRGDEKIEKIEILRRGDHDDAFEVQLENGISIPRVAWKAMPTEPDAAPDQRSDEP
ncbi:MAG: peptidylprolyl isomerase [Phycisphaerales bacterium]|nr:peptidylprolyl isomerase [Phycisphaerales bacterium]